MKNSLFDTYIVTHWARRVLVWNELHYKRSIHVNKDENHFLGILYKEDLYYLLLNYSKIC